MQRFSLKSALALSASAAMLAGAMAVPAYSQSSVGISAEDEVVSIGTRRKARSAADTPAPSFKGLTSQSPASSPGVMGVGAKR